MVHRKFIVPIYRIPVHLYKGGCEEDGAESFRSLGIEVDNYSPALAFVDRGDFKIAMWMGDGVKPSILVHESFHVMENVWNILGEERPGSEASAWLLGWIAERVFEFYNGGEEKKSG